MRFRVPPSMRLVPVTAMLSLALLSAVDARAATGPADAGIEPSCLPLQYREGAVAYRECLAEANRAPETLPFDDRHAIERVCAADDGGCVATQLTALERAPAPALDALDAAERGAIRRQCAAAPLEGGAADYRRCLGDAVVALAALPSPDLGALALPERATLELDCAAERDTAAGYRRCLLDALGIDAGEASLGTDDRLDAGDDAALDLATPEPIANEPLALAPAPSDAPEPPTVEPSGTGTRNAPDVGAAEPLASPAADASAAPGPGSATDAPAADASADALEASEASPPPDLGQRAEDARARVLATIDGLDGTERVVLATAFALPLLLLAFWSIARGARAPRTAPPAFGEPVRNAALAGRVAPSMRGVDDDDFPSDVDADGTVPDELERDRAEFAAFDDGDLFDDDLEPRTAAPVADGPDEASDGERVDEDARADFTPRSAFGRRLLGDRTALERGHAIEFLIYWMAYGDERYEPQARTALLAGGDDGDPHALIKRHVLEEDTDAFADVVRWLQSRCGEIERTQIVDLLMALLVGERAMTPAQNTLLHFLADALGLGAQTLSRRHEEAFGRPMPPLARVDLAAWWERVEPESTLRWDARSVAALDELAQDRVRLGLPPDGELDETAIVETFRHAARRCQPHRFDALGERERALVERQFVKYEAARDRLLGVETAGADT